MPASIHRHSGGRSCSQAAGVSPQKTFRWAQGPLRSDLTLSWQGGTLDGEPHLQARMEPCRLAWAQESCTGQGRHWERTGGPGETGHECVLWAPRHVTFLPGVLAVVLGKD